MEITVRINAGPTPDQTALAQVFAWASKLDQSGTVTMVGPITTTVRPKTADTGKAATTVAASLLNTTVFTQPLVDESDALGMAEDFDGVEGENTDSADDNRPGGDASSDPAASAAADLANTLTTRRKGRPPGSKNRNAAQQAEAMAAADAPPAPVSQAASAPAPGPAIPPGALPPGVSMPGTAQPVAAPVQDPPAPVQQAAAIPPASPVAAAMPAAPAADGVTLEDLRACYRAISETAGIPKTFALLKSAAWSDGTAKPKWFTIESVTDEHRVRMMDELAMLA